MDRRRGFRRFFRGRLGAGPRQEFVAMEDAEATDRTAPIGLFVERDDGVIAMRRNDIAPPSRRGAVHAGARQAEAPIGARPAHHGIGQSDQAQPG